MSAPRVALAPEQGDWSAGAVREGGGVLVGVDEQPDALVWEKPGDYADLTALLAGAPSVRWVQLPFAGVEGVPFDDAHTWTCAKGAYAEPVAEHTLALALAGLRRLPERACATSWGPPGARTLYDARVLLLGGGGITAALLGLLAPFRTEVTVVRRDAGKQVDGAARTVGLEELDEVLPGALVVVLALALTPETEHVIGPRQLELMDDDAWLVNVARGGHVDTPALVEALRAGQIGGAALDVTDPEPLPDGSPLWSLPNCLITPHTANPRELARPLLARMVTENVRRFAAGDELLGVVDVAAGY